MEQNTNIPQQDNDVPELEWKPLLESIDESTGKPSIWSTEINSEKYGRYLWIAKNEHGTYEVEYDTGRGGYGSIIPISSESTEFRSLSDAKFWAQDWAEENGILQVEKISENEPREEIDADLAVEMVNSGFHVFIDKSDEQITYDMAFGHHPERFDFENHTFTAPMMEVAQYNATVALCEKFDSLNNDVRADIGRSLEDYADELFDNDESEFMWNNGLSEWENINTSILSGETEYLHNFLNDVSVHYSSRTADLLEDLNDYTAAYLNRNKVEHIPQQQDISHNNADPSAGRGERQNTMENKKLTEQGETQDKAAESTEQQEMNGWDDLYDYGSSKFGPDDNAYPYGLDNNADPSAKRGERQNIMADKNERSTKIKVTSMTMVDSETKTSPNLRALATVALNDEFVIKGIKVIAKKDNAKDDSEKADNFFVSMPSRSFKGEYSDIIFPITKQAREQLNNAIIESFSELAASGETTLDNRVDSPKKSVSDISVSLHRVDGDHTKAAGQIVIDDNFVITGVKVVEGINKDGVNKTFVQMPSYQTQTGEYSTYANPITTDMHNRIQNKVLTAYELLPVYRGVRFGELGDKENVAQYFNQNNSFAQKLMDVLDAEGISYNAKITGTTTLAIKSEDKERVDKFKDDLSEALKNEREAKRIEKKQSISERLTQAKKIAEKHNEHKSDDIKKHKEQEL